VSNGTDEQRKKGKGIHRQPIGLCVVKLTARLARDVSGDTFQASLALSGTI